MMNVLGWVMCGLYEANCCGDDEACWCCNDDPMDCDCRNPRPPVARLRPRGAAPRAQRRGNHAAMPDLFLGTANMADYCHDWCCRPVGAKAKLPATPAPMVVSPVRPGSTRGARRQPPTPGRGHPSGGGGVPQQTQPPTPGYGRGSPSATPRNPNPATVTSPLGFRPGTPSRSVPQTRAVVAPTIRAAFPTAAVPPPDAAAGDFAYFSYCGAMTAAEEEEWVSKRDKPWQAPRACEGLSVRSLVSALYGWVAFAKTALGWWNEEALDCLVGRKIERLRLGAMMSDGHVGALLSAVMTTRAAYLRMFPYCAPAALFVHQMASTPVCFLFFPMYKPSPLFDKLQKDIYRRSGVERQTQVRLLARLEMRCVWGGLISLSQTFFSFLNPRTPPVLTPHTTHHTPHTTHHTPHTTHTCAGAGAQRRRRRGAS